MIQRIGWKSAHRGLGGEVSAGSRAGGFFWAALAFCVAWAMTAALSFGADAGDGTAKDEKGVAAKAPYGKISQEQWQKLEKIRDAIGPITNLEKLYQDRTHPNGLPYHLYVPAALKPNQAYPLVVFLHGYSDLTIDTHKGFPKGVWSLPQVQEKHPHILFVPRYRSFADQWIHDDYRTMVMAALDDLIREFNKGPDTPHIDADRIYLTGFSQGGMGTWNYVRHAPDRFAAVCPLSGFSCGPQNLAEAKAIRHVPIWIFNGDGDRGVGGSRLSYQLLKEAGAPDVRYHEYVNHGHVIDDIAYFTDGFFDWLFAQRRPSKNP
jgi:predicted peptidase